MALLTGSKVGVTLDGTPILRELDFDIPAGEWTGLIGPNGSGKTTLLRAINGLVAYEGSLQLDGREIRYWSPRALARRMAFVRQSTPLSFDFRVDELVMLGRAPHKGWLDTNSAADRSHVQQALERVDLLPLADRSVLSLSGGERQRVFLAQALVQQADVLLLDEPTTHLDVHYQFAFLEVVHEMVREGRTVIAVFHDLELAARYADRLLVMHQGQLHRTGTPTEVLTSDLLASIFRMKATVDHGTGDGPSIRYHAALPANGASAYAQTESHTSS